MLISRKTLKSKAVCLGLTVGAEFPQTLPRKKYSARTKTLVFVILIVILKENTHIWFSDS